jgi:hypothetical protein
MVVADRHRCLSRPDHRDSWDRRHSFGHSLGIVNNGIITVALIGSVSLLVGTLASHKEPPLRLLRSGAELWLTNVLVFSLGNRLRVAAFNARRRGESEVRARVFVDALQNSQGTALSPRPHSMHATGYKTGSSLSVQRARRN